jgi:hypothetical protein
VARFSVCVQSASSADANEPSHVLWNPHGSMALRVYKAEANAAAAVSGGVTVRLARVTALGTSGASTSPDADNHFGRRATPVSGALLHRGNWTANATENTPPLLVAYLGAVAASCVEWWFPSPIIVPAGTGLGIFVSAAVTGNTASFEWEE